MLQIPTHIWPIFYTGRAQMIAIAGVCLDLSLGPTHAVSIDGKPRREAIQITRIAFTYVAELTREDPGQCGLLGASELIKELERQKPELLGEDPVTLVSFRRRMEDRG